MSGKPVKILLVAAGILLLVVGFWPNADSLYDLTGEEELPAQLRGVIHWANSAVRPQPDQSHEADLKELTEVPYGMNTFLLNQSFTSFYCLLLNLHHSNKELIVG